MDHILEYIRTTVGPAVDYTPFDPDMLLFINSAFSDLYSLGIGPENGFKVTENDAPWSDFLEEGPILEWCKEFIYLNVRLRFDPPSNSFLVNALKERVTELRNLLNAEREAKKFEEEETLND